MTRHRWVPAAVVAVVLGLALWQLATEIRQQLLLADVDALAYAPLPTGAPFALRQIGMVPGVAVAGLLVAGAVLIAVLLAAVALVLRRGAPRRGTTFLAVWMAVVIAGSLAALAASPLRLSHIFPTGLPDSQPLSLFLYQELTRGTWWGVAVGWSVALLVALIARPAPLAETATYGSAPGRPAAPGEPTAPPPGSW